MLYVIMMLIVGLGLPMVMTHGGRTSPQLRSIFALGLDAWCRFMPMIAMVALLLLLAGNLFGRFYVVDSALSMRGLFSRVEVLILLVSLPLFLTPLGHLIGALVTFYILAKAAGSNDAVAPVLTILLMAYTTLAMLGDKLFANPGQMASGSAKFRAGIGMLLAFGSVFVIILTLADMVAFNLWCQKMFAWVIPTPFMFLALISLFTAWVFVALGYHVPFLLPMIILPSLLPLVFITGLHPVFTLVPFTIALSLTLTSFETWLMAAPRAMRAF